MWMMGCTGGREFEVHDSFNGRKLRPLVPRHNPSVSSSSSAHPPSFNSIHGHDFLGQLHHFTNVNDESKRQVNNSPQVVVSSRWNPTPEQLRALEELYRRGTRTPSAEQIQHITSQLRRYGKIEGKNVFYWFQNHKARERQKRRRQLESSPHSPPPDIQILKGKDTGASRAVYEDEQTKNRPPLTNCSALSEESISTQRAPKGSIFTECMAEGRIQTEKEELIHRKNLAERNSTWQLMQASSRPLSLPNQLINTSRRTSLITARNMDPNFIKTDDFNIFMAPPYRENGLQLMNLMSNQEYYCQNPDQSETLELFPLCSGNGNDNDNYNYNDDNGRKEFEISTSGIDGNIGSHQFFEFLPLKN